MWKKSCSINCSDNFNGEKVVAFASYWRGVWEWANGGRDKEIREILIFHRWEYSNNIGIQWVLKLNIWFNPKRCCSGHCSIYKVCKDSLSRIIVSSLSHVKIWWKGIVFNVYLDKCFNQTLWILPMNITTQFVLRTSISYESQSVKS